MALTVSPLHPVFAAELIGVDFAHRLTTGEVSAVRDAMVALARASRG